MKKMFAAMTAALLLASLASGMVAAKSTTNLIGGQWRIWNYMPATSSLWDINKTQTVGGANPSQSFPVQQFLTPTTGSFAVYLEANYNNPITGKTFSATADWTSGTYSTRSTPASGAYGRFWFQDVASSSFTSSDYWWYSGPGGVLDLSGSAPLTETAALSDRANWSNVCGQFANNTNTYPGPNCVGTTDPAVSPYDGFTNAMANVKEVGLSFGSSSRYASGIALDGGTGTFTMTSFTVTP
jgi:hypothetical protein